MKCCQCGTKVVASKELAETPGAQAICANCRSLSNYYQTERRCLVTKNICGTDTWMKGRPCKCEECQAYLDEYIDWLHRRVVKLRREVLVVSENPLVLEQLTLENISLRKENEDLKKDVPVCLHPDALIGTDGGGLICAYKTDRDHFKEKIKEARVALRDGKWALVDVKLTEALGDEYAAKRVRGE